MSSKEKTEQPSRAKKKGGRGTQNFDGKRNQDIAENNNGIK